MAASDYAALLTALGSKSASGFIQALEERGVYVIASPEDPTDLNAGNISALLFDGVLFWYDPADSTTAHDGTSCIVTADGRRYKSDQYSGVSSRWIAVLDKDLAAPPGSPALQATYIVAAGGSGAWAGKDKKFATWTARGWVFLTPKAFDYAFVRDEVLIYYYSAAGVWTSGIPASTIANDSVSRNKLNYYKLGPVSVENQTTNAPPGSPANGVAYVVGGSPTGAWAANALDVVIRENGAWIFYDNYEGAQIYDKSLDKNYRSNGATWVSSANFDKLAMLVAMPAVNSFVINNTVITKPYLRLQLLLRGVSHSTSNRTYRIELSGDNGASFGAAIDVSVALASSGITTSEISIDNADVASGNRLIQIKKFDSVTPAPTWTTLTQSITSGAINCIRVSLDSSGNFDLGDYTLIGTL